MSSQDAHVAIDQKLAAKFEELFASRGNPTELDDAFIQEYFSVLDDEVEDTGFAWDKKQETFAHFGSPTGSLLKVVIPSKEKQLFVKGGLDGESIIATMRQHLDRMTSIIYDLEPPKVVILPGFSRIYGHVDGEFHYVLANSRKKFVSIGMIKPGGGYIWASSSRLPP